MKKLWILLLAVLTLMCGCTAIEEPGETAPASLTAETAASYPVEAGGLIFNSSPPTVGTLSPAVTEMIYELGFGDRLIFRGSYCDYPEAALLLPEAGSAANPDINSIIGFSPSLFITQSPVSNKDMTLLREAGIAVLSLRAPSSVNELLENYDILAGIFAGITDGAALSDEVTRSFRLAVEGARGSCRSIVFIMNITADGFSVGTGDSFAGDYVSLFGKNIAADNRFLSMTAEELTAADPQVIFLANPLGSSDIDPEISSKLTAFSEGHVFVIDASLTERPTARLAGITSKVAETVRADTGGAGYAETAPAADPEDEIYETAQVNDGALV